MKLIGITMGDPAGVGPEIILKALDERKDLREKSVIFGSYKVLNYYKGLLKINTDIKVIQNLNEFEKEVINVINVVDLDIDDFEIGEVSALCGDAAYRYIEKAIEAAKKGEVKAVATAPLNKEALHLGGHNFAGHTEIFATLTDTNKYAMMLTNDNFRVIHVSTHVSLREACDRAKKERILDVINLANDTLKKMGIENPRIAVAGLNPHAGENGLFGYEEIEEIIPAVDEALKLGLTVEGPIAPDTVFLKAHKGKYDVVVAMYHDQGHIPMKMLAFDTGVNMTVGLPIIRTSVDHGTAFDIAGKGIAKGDSMIEALKVAELF
ncbi:4-hydroxythreonine-4-phosphate dehydrogenase PdxA [Clostridium sporogenes]|jgi:4-phospho-D-threonate 3-dehydrogenase / 4-phospho-D-erythronate 3-dehydrogenase|uniref:Putative D-threonate 4-phosphate dehydrogenase n=1 Tax=Clostridium thermopalmarium DSM 5974 TaxID=1121340 RepID=A0A2T0ASZ8_9CLOT|nr:4-hydroxythreonine-4-phosphate dehydrogenase PdxA [Clostridium thermopalmarium]PRR73225.1 4-hydroxythreonine-4-phosphate dehydrogenase 2 [Clostridium thermopalmarium DSM 5974]PVZ25211.1 4-hydroxythreonine-4-phosphate dehydrogenase [Clostridium thermopalmarium DSM 5974]